MTERAELGVDGNCGFALVGPDLQVGEAEFEEFAGDVSRKSKRSFGIFQTRALHLAWGALARQLS